MQQKEFINARYAELKPKIEIEEKSGKTVIDCQHCKMHSGIVVEDHAWGTDYSCLVCGVNDVTIAFTNETIECPNCSSEFEFFNKSVTSCPHCEVEVTTDILIDQCEKKYTEGDGWWEEGQTHIAGCHECQNERPSVFFIDSLWSCVSCFDRGWQATSCPRCDEFVTGDMEKIKHFACYKCEDDVIESFRADGF